MPAMSSVSARLPFGSVMVTVVDDGTVDGFSGSVYVTETVSPGSILPSVAPFVPVIEVTKGLASSVTCVAAKLVRLPAASRTPFGSDASAMVMSAPPVSTAPAPSVSVSLIVAPVAFARLSVPPDGTLASVHGAVPAVITGQRLGERDGDAVDLAVRVEVLQQHRHGRRGRLVRGRGRCERGLVAGRVTNARGVTGERDLEVAERGGGARPRRV